MPGVEFREKDGDIVPYDDAPDDALVRYSVIDETEYMISASAAAQSLIEPVMPAEVPAEPEINGSKAVGPAERLQTVQHRFEFYPIGKTELNDTYDVTGKDLVGGAAQQLNIVLLRQKQHMEHPDRTVRSIVGRYHAYAEHAHTEAAFLSMLEGEVAKSEAHPFARADSISAVGVWRYEPSVARPLLNLLQQHDIAAFAQGETEANPLESTSENIARTYSLANKETVARLQRFVEGLRVSELKGELASAFTQQQHRFNFWVNILKQSEKHAAARGVAHEALVDLKVAEK
jgi:hypothetical protein